MSRIDSRKIKFYWGVSYPIQYVIDDDDDKFAYRATMVGFVILHPMTPSKMFWDPE